MTSVSDRFEQLRSHAQCALIPFITAGDPDLQTTAEALQLLDRSGADLIELGVPYSDPLADGPVIQAAATRALQQGTRLDSVLEMVADITPALRSPLILFTYYNPILNRGIEPFLQQVAKAGVRGLVVPDLPLEEADRLLQSATEVGVEVVLLVAPTSSKERIRAIAQRSQGFIYLVSTTGVTGMRSRVEGRVQDLLAELRSVTDKPIGVGFGISQPEQARQVREWGSDAVIVGSAFVKRLADSSRTQGLRSITEFCQSLKARSPRPRLTEADWACLTEFWGMVLYRYLLFYKPYNVLTQFTDDPATEQPVERDRQTLKDYIPVPSVYPVGRLDRDSEGLLLLTNHGQVQHRLSDPQFQHPRTYWVQVERVPDPSALQALRQGVVIQGYRTKPAVVNPLSTEPCLPPRQPPIRFRKQVPTAWLELTLTEGRNRQVRRMTAAVGFPTLRLVRVAIAHLRLTGLQPGQWRELSPTELDTLYHLLSIPKSQVGGSTKA